MKTVKILGDTLNKVTDTSTVFDFRLWNGGQAQDVTGKTVSFVIANDSGYLFDVPAVVDGNVISLDFSNELLKQLTPDTYRMEVSVTNADGDVELYPSEGAIDFTVGKNLHGTQGKLVPQITFDTVLASVDEKITEYTKTIAKGDKGDTGPQGPQGERGKQVFKSVSEYYDQNSLGHWWSDLTPAVSGDNPPKIGDTIITSSGDVFQINAVNVGDGGGGGGTFGVGGLLVNIKGPQGPTGPVGPQGPKGDTGPQGIQGPQGPSNDAQLVHKTGTETIAGDKTFAGNVQFSGGVNIVSATTRGRIPDGGDLNNYTETYKYVINDIKDVKNYPSGASHYGTLEVEKINGDTSTQKIIDADKNVFISSVWGVPLHRTSWIKLANDENVVHNTGNETIAGDKTFTGKVMIGGGNYQTPVSATANYLGSTISFMRIGNQVTFTSSISSFTSDVVVGLTSGVIPLGFRPALQQNVRANSQAASAAFFSFNGDGAIYSYSAYPSGTQPRVSSSYITTDAWPNN